MAEYTDGRSTSWREALRRTGRLLSPGGRRHTVWAVLVPLVAALAGVMLTTSARTAAGTNLRDDRRPELSRLIEERRQQVQDDESVAGQLRRDVDAGTAGQAGSDSRIADQQERAGAVRAEAGLTALRGPGLTVSLDDAPRRPDGSLPPGAAPDDVVVHQQDVQSVVNALWAGGAEAMTIMGVRVISTSAVRCVGNTLLLHGQVYSPPFEIGAIGDPAAMTAALEADPGVGAFRDAVRAWGLGYSVAENSDITAPAFSGSISLDHAEAVR